MFATLRHRFTLLAAFAVMAAVASPAVFAKGKKGTDQAVAKKDAGPQIQIAILLDTSGSMSGLINQARTQLWKIVNEFATAEQEGKPPQLTVALYEYGKSSLPAKEGYLRMIVPLTDDLDKISEELFALKTNGGSEYCGQVISRATEELDWSKSGSDLKCIFIAGNEPFTQGPVKFQDACESAIKKGITVSTIFCGPASVGIQTQWQQGALLADGSYMAIDHNQKAPVIEAPQDKQLAELSNQINTTYVAYGAKQAREAAIKNQVAQDANAAQSNQAAAASRAQFKGSGLYNNARWDLVDACRLGKVKLEDLKEDQLPEFLKKMKPAERKAYIEKKAKERKEIQEKIKKLSEERTKYVAAELKKLAEGGKNTLDQAIINAARKQATQKNFKFKN